LSDRLGFFELVGIAVEGAFHRFCGRPRHACPYSLEYALDAFHAWDLGSGDADYLLDIRGEQEARRWLEDAA
jgi:hypothetical protein